MKKIYIGLILVIVNLQLFAQKNKWAIKAGYNYSSGKAVYTNIKQTVVAKHGFGIGLHGEIPFDGLLYFTPAIQYNLKGFVVKPKSGIYTKEDYSIHYIEISPLLSIIIPQQNENSFCITAGPQLGISNFGKLKLTNTSGTSTSSSLKFGYGGIGWFDFSLYGGIGYHLKKYTLDAGYTLGLSNINNLSDEDGRELKNRMLSVRIGYYFK